MGVGTGIFLIAVGAILAFGIEPDVWSVMNINVIGYILMGAGVLSLVLALALNKQRANTSHHEVVERYDNRTPRPPQP